ncbi:hypothetical protein PLICRDRAFT_475195 [Plicaturopsis crispa FD-325 SS-3]|nr:hypothetical protein PLICRDRAFT_475195 [Plicaturopsis crispa FD-325 SS-3]
MVVRIFRRPLITPSSTSATVLNAAIPTLKVVRTAANASHASILGSVASVLLTCVETVKDARTNKEDAVELIVRIIALVLPTIKWMQEMHFPTTPVAQSLLHDLQALIPTFEQVSSAMTKITRRNFFAQVVLSLADKDIIQQQRRMLDSALHNFTVTSLMRIQVVSSIETEIDYTICKAPDVELVEEVHDLELDPQSKCATCSTFSCNERFQRLYRGRLRVDGSSVKVFQYKQDTNALHFLADVRRHQDLLCAPAYRAVPRCFAGYQQQGEDYCCR